MMLARRHVGAHGAKADDTGAYLCDRPREAKLSNLCDGGLHHQPFLGSLCSKLMQEGATDLAHLREAASSSSGRKRITQLMQQQLQRSHQAQTCIMLHSRALNIRRLRWRIERISAACVSAPSSLCVARVPRRIRGCRCPGTSKS